MIPIRTRLFDLASLILLTALILVLLAAAMQTSQEVANAATSSLTDIKFSFKLDPSITRGTYMGDRWVSPPTYEIVQEGETVTVIARVQGLDAGAKLRDISPEWTPEDPDMVSVSPRQGPQVAISVRRAGQTSLEVASQGFSKKLFIKAAYQGNIMQVEISQKP